MVFDGSPVDFPWRLPPSVQVLYTGHLSGANTARMMGVNVAKGDYVAFLDDDDVWRPDKLAKQVETLTQAAESHKYAVVTCRVDIVDRERRITFPTRWLRPGESVAEYLFRRRRLSYGEALIHTSTIVCHRELLSHVPWEEGLSRHQDWDWLLKVMQRDDVQLLVCWEHLVDVIEKAQSISRGGSWETSRAWAHSSMQSGRLDKRQFADFLLCHTAPLAGMAEGRRARLRLLREAVTHGSPSVAALAFFVAQQSMPPERLTQLARVVRSPQRRKAA